MTGAIRTLPKSGCKTGQTSSAGDPQISGTHEVGDTDHHPYQACWIHPHLCRLQMHIELGITRKCIPSTSGAASSTLPGQRESLRQTALAQAYQQLPAAFWAVKSLLMSSSILMQYREAFPLVLTCDAFTFGIGAVLSHKMPNGTEAPITFFLKTLSAADHNYSQIDKEALAAVASVNTCMGAISNL